MKFCVKITLIVFVILFSMHASGLAADKGKFSMDPKKNNGIKWRIGYYEGGEYINYQVNLVATIKGLMNLGWIKAMEIPPQ